MPKVFLARKKIQALGRIVLDSSALQNAQLEIGDDVAISFDTDTSAILIEKVNEAVAGASAAAPRTGPRRIKVFRK